MGGLVVHGADLLGAQVGDLDLDVPLVGGERALQPGVLPVWQVLLVGAQDVPDPVQRSFLRPRWPWMSCWTRRRTSSTTAVAK